MRKAVALALASVAMVLMVAAPGQARDRGGPGFRGGLPGHGFPPGVRQGFEGRRHFDGPRRFERGRAHVFIGVGPSFYWGPSWYYYPYEYAAPPVVVEEPPVYIQKPTGYWYYCPSTRAYYPNVPACDQPWVPVPARPE